MPAYELSLVLRQMSQPEIASVLKRTMLSVLNKDGIIRKLENMGSRALPHKISEHGVVHKEGIYFGIQFNSAPGKIFELKDELSRDIDVIRRHIFKVEDTQHMECTLHEELQPPSYRKNVKKMIDISKRKQKKKYDYNSGMDYYPFQK